MTNLPSPPRFHLDANRRATAALAIPCPPRPSLRFTSCFMFGTGVTNLNERLRVFAASPLLRVREQTKQKTVRDEGVIYVADHPLLNRRCTRLTGCIRLWNELCRIVWGIKLYSLTPFYILTSMGLSADSVPPSCNGWAQQPVVKFILRICSARMLQMSSACSSSPDFAPY